MATPQSQDEGHRTSGTQSAVGQRPASGAAGGEQAAERHGEAEHGKA